MNWPDPGMSEHPPRDGEDARDVSEAPSRDGWLSEDDLATSPRPWDDAGDPLPITQAEDPGVAETPTYAQLRSESDGRLGRWEHHGPPGGSSDESSPATTEDAPALDPTASPVVDEPLPGANSEPGDADPAAPPIPRDDAPDEPPAQTHEDGSSRAEIDDETSGSELPAISPHEGSWDAPLGAPAGVVQDDEPEVPLPGAAVPPVDEAAFHGEHRPDAEHGDAPPPSADLSTTDLPERIPPGISAAVIEDALSALEETTRNATVICVANQKGGVGKTTTTVSLGAALAMEGAQVLVVDLDPQGNATTGLGLRAQEGAPSTYRVLVEQMDVEDAVEPTAVRGLHVLPSSLDLAGAEIELVPAFSRENRLKSALDAVRDLYDVILIDCPPSLGLLTINALVAADQVLVPIQCEYYALEGLGQLMRTVKLVADSLNRGLAVGGVVLTMFDGRTNLSQQVVDEVRGYFGDIAYQTIVPRTVRLSEAPSYGQPIAVFDASSRGARAYQRLAREVARRLDLQLEEEEVSPLDRLLGASRPAPDDGAPLPTDLVPEDVPTGTEPAPFAGEHAEPSAGERSEPVAASRTEHEQRHDEPALEQPQPQQPEPQEPQSQQPEREPEEDAWGGLEPDPAQRDPHTEGESAAREHDGRSSHDRPQHEHDPPHDQRQDDGHEYREQQW